jgi:flagellar protein FliO/FliZ
LRLATGGALAVCGALVRAAETAAVEPIGIGEIARVSGGLLIVVVLIVATAAGLKRLKSLQVTAGAQLKIVDGVSISSRDRIVLLEVGGERIVLGVSPGRIQALHVLGTANGTRPGFADLVDRADADLRAAAEANP